MDSYFPGSHPKTILLDHMVYSYLDFKVCSHLPTCIKAPLSPHPVQRLLTDVFLTYAISLRSEMQLHVHISVGLLYIFSGKLSFQIRSPFFN